MSTDTSPSNAAPDAPAAVVVTPSVLRDWPLPGPGSSKYDRGQVLVVGGDRRSPGAALLAAEATLRVGAGRLTVALAESVALTAAVALPESGIVELPEVDRHIDGTRIDAAASDLESADAVLVGPGLDDADQARELLDRLPGLVGESTLVVLDAYALGVLPKSAAREAFSGRLVLTPNVGEAGRLLEGAGDTGSVGGSDSDGGSDGEPDVDAIARAVAAAYGAVVSCQNRVAHPDGRLWRIGTGHGGLGTSGSGDVLAGAITGLCARGVSPEQAAVWATHAHAAAGDRLAVRVGPLGFLASELLAELPRVLVEVG